MESKQSSTLSFLDQLVVPGDVILDLSSMANQTIKLGDGLRQDGDSISVLKAGKLRFTEPNIYWVESSQNMHVPDAGDNVLGVPVDTKPNDIVDDKDNSDSSTSASCIAGCYIPDDLMSVFFRDFPLHRLPSLYLLIKRFAELVRDPSFSKLRSHRAIFVMFNNNYNLLENQNGVHSRLLLPFPSVFPNQFCEYQLGGSALGLVFLRQVTLFCKERLIVLNPITQCYEYLPVPELRQPCRLTIGCGAAVIDENKVFYFRLTRYDPSQPCDSCTADTCGGLVLEILDVINCIWSKIENPELEVHMFQDLIGTFCKGNLYWLAFRDELGRFCDNLIISLDCKEQVFKEIYLSELERKPFYDDHLGVIGGDLCLVTINVANVVDVVRVDGNDFFPLWSFLLPDGDIKYITMTNDGGVYMYHKDIGIVRSQRKNRCSYDHSYDILDFKYTEDETNNLSAIEFDQTFHFSLNFARGGDGL